MGIRWWADRWSPSSVYVLGPLNWRTFARWRGWHLQTYRWWFRCRRVDSFFRTTWQFLSEKKNIFFLKLPPFDLAAQGCQENAFAYHPFAADFRQITFRCAFAEIFTAWLSLQRLSGNLCPSSFTGTDALLLSTCQSCSRNERTVLASHRMDTWIWASPFLFSWTNHPPIHVLIAPTQSCFWPPTSWSKMLFFVCGWFHSFHQQGIAADARTIQTHATHFELPNSKTLTLACYQWLIHSFFSTTLFTKNLAQWVGEQN